MNKEDSVGYRIKKLNNILERRLICEAKKNNEILMTLAQGKIMRYLFFNKDKIIYQKDIEKELGLRGSTASGILNTMEKNNLIIRLKYNGDARKKQIQLTDIGIEKVENMKEKIKEFEIKLKKDISEEELKIFFKVLDKIKDNINKEEIC